MKRMTKTMSMMMMMMMMKSKKYLFVLNLNPFAVVKVKVVDEMERKQTLAEVYLLVAKMVIELVFCEAFES